MPTRVSIWLVPAAWVIGVSAVLLLLFPVGFPNYDTIYALLWGRELAHGMTPDVGSELPPTPHPLTELFGLATAPLGYGAITATMVIAYVVLGLIGFFIYRLGAIWFDRWIGAVAAAIVLTRAPFLSNGLRAYIDLPYIALCLAALLVEAKDPRAGRPVLLLLALAGLLRPEAWLFAAIYWAWLAFELRDRRLAWRRERNAKGLAWLGALAITGPVLWALFDAITAGDPFYSWTGTKETVETLERQTGPIDLMLYGPRRLGEVLQWPGMVGAAGGVVLGLAFMRRRSGLGATAAALALLAFAILACGGLAILPRYTMLAGAILAIFAALGLLGWRLLPADHRWRRRWIVFASVVALMFVAWGPSQWGLLHRIDVDLTRQGEIESALHEIADSGAFQPLCLPLVVPNHRAVPRLAFDLGVRPSSIVSYSKQEHPRQGYFLKPASRFVVHNFILDPKDPSRFATVVPAEFRETGSNEYWVVYRHCRQKP